ncbi:MAG: hypothetical protein AAF465_08200 [Pseudomonadota bacterium]
MMQGTSKTNFFDDVISDEPQATDTSIFNAADIVDNIEKRVALSTKNKVIETRAEAKRRFEAIREERRLRAELEDLDDYSFDD